MTKVKYRVILSLVALTFMSVANLYAETKVSTKGGLKVSSGDYSFQLGGRIQYDYNKARKNGITDEDDFDLRRGRLYVKGNVAKDWAFKAQANIDGSGVEDMYLRYTGWGKMANVTVGNQKMPFGLEEIISSKDIIVLERSAITERYAIGRAEGLQLHGVINSHISYGVGVFSDDTPESDWGIAARYTYAPIIADESVLHLGVAYKDVADDNALGFEVGAVKGAFHLQAEYVDGQEGDNDLSGYYIQAGYVITGESRPYSGGKFKRIKPARKSGAWELVARYEDGDGNHSDIELGKTDATARTIGINYYPHNNVRIGVNYTDGEDNIDGDEGDEFRVRFQLTF